MRKYQAFFRIRFINTLQYRSAAIAGMATQLAWGLMEILAFHAFYQADPSAFPMTFQQTVLSLFMLWFFEAEIFNTITTGSIAYELVRPMNLYNRWFCQSAANRLAKAVLRCGPIFVIAFLLPAPYRLILPANIVALFLFLLSMALSLGVVIAMSQLVYISTFYTLSSIGVRIVISSIGEFLAGGVIPLPFFPQPFRQFVELLPFASMQNVPLRIYNGDLTGFALVSALLLQAFWLVLLIVIGKIWLQQALKRVVVQGG